MVYDNNMQLNGRHPSKRGISIAFGPDIAHKFLNDNNLGNIVLYCIVM